jgi:hypothetical protein
MHVLALLYDLVQQIAHFVAVHDALAVLMGHHTGSHVSQLLRGGFKRGKHGFNGEMHVHCVASH